MGVDRAHAEASVADVQVYDFGDTYGFEVISDKGKACLDAVTGLGETESKLPDQKPHHKKPSLLTDYLLNKFRNIQIYRTFCHTTSTTDTQEQGKDIVFIAGGIGLAPVRSLILYCMKNREDFGKLTII